jgi:hypothetical protein
MIGVLSACSREELLAYVKARPELKRGFATICEPPCVYWEDEEGDIVARYYADGPGQESGHAVLRKASL